MGSPSGLGEGSVGIPSVSIENFPVKSVYLRAGDELQLSFALLHVVVLCPIRTFIAAWIHSFCEHFFSTYCFPGPDMDTKEE
jgi:hypothetical protein